MTKPFLITSIVVAGTLLGSLHYKLKPLIDEKEVSEYAQTMSSSIEWQGHIAPDFDLVTTRGDHFKLSDNMGEKMIVLNFFATWCDPCREEMSELDSYSDEHAADSFILIGIDADEKKDVVDQFVRELKVDFPVGIDDGSIEKRYGVAAFPTTVVIGVDGKVQFYEAGALANANVAFDNLLKQNRELIAAGHVISSADYRRQAQTQPVLPSHQANQENSNSDTQDYKLDERGKRIIARMDCPCGCDKKVSVCTCSTSTNIKKALTNEDFKGKSDDEIIRELNKRFCVGGT